MLVFFVNDQVKAIHMASSIHFYRNMHSPEEMYFSNNTTTTKTEYIYSHHDFILFTIPTTMIIVAYFLQNYNSKNIYIYFIVN
jgi:hypothetical protein